MKEVILHWHEEGYASIMLNRPNKLNSITPQMTEDLHNALEEALKFEELKFLIVTGAGERAFCSGGDLNELHGDLSADDAYQTLHPMKEVLLKLALFPVPTIAILNGIARGGGCEIATACDFRYGLADGEYGFVQANLGICPGWGGGALLYKRILPVHAALWLMQANLHKAEDTLHSGWLHKIITKSEIKGTEILKDFLNKTPAQLRWFKQQYLSEINAAELNRQMEQEVKQCASLWESEEHKQAVQNFLKTRKKS
ncbi:enoyl-CoA hydratase/isomerase family protein [Halobacillus rhizosphaerae]|uniref:enoyl-CoA hydratase/isomerase family protein n=1 Tax=Halobacillus rhizosphaerae TaxID=3064889 RepID=UPI00398BA9C5